MSTHAFRGLAVLAFGAVVACSRTTEPASRFGSHYRILLTPEPPVLMGSTVSMTLSYGGCRRNHEFQLHHRIESTGASIWLRKVTPDEPCDMVVTERREFTLTGAAGSADVVVLLSPDSTVHQVRP